MVYAVVYLGNPKNETVRTRMELASDDSILVKLDDCEVFQRRVNRSFAESGTVQDAVAVEIAPGSHRLLVKAFNNSGDFGFRLRFTDPSTGAPITDTTTPAIRSSFVPEDLGVKLIKPVGLELRREVTPELVIGLDKVSHVVLKALVTFAKLDGATRVTVRERLPGGTLLEPGSARPGLSGACKNTVGSRSEGPDGSSGPYASQNQPYQGAVYSMKKLFCDCNFF